MVEHIETTPAPLRNGARDLSRRNRSTEETTAQNAKGSFTDQQPCGLPVLRSRLTAEGGKPALSGSAEDALDRKSALLGSFHGAPLAMPTLGFHSPRNR